MERQLLFFILILLTSCSGARLQPSNRDTYSQKTAYAFSTSNDKPKVTPQQAIAKTSAIENGTYKLLLSKYPKRAKQLLISIALTCTDYNDSGYIAFLDRLDNIGIGVDFSWSNIYPYQNKTAFIKGKNDRIKLNILIDHQRKSYALLVQDNTSKEVFRTKSKPFLHPAFAIPHKLEIAAKGNFTLNQVTLHNI